MRPVVLGMGDVKLALLNLCALDSATALALLVTLELYALVALILLGRRVYPTDGATVRDASEDDATACAAIYAPYRAMGFEPVGVYRRIGWKFGAWHDVAWMQRALGAEQNPPPEPR